LAGVRVSGDQCQPFFDPLKRAPAIRNGDRPGVTELSQSFARIAELGVLAVDPVPVRG
jgi:hypothetical protein